MNKLLHIDLYVSLNLNLLDLTQSFYCAGVGVSSFNSFASFSKNAFMAFHLFDGLTIRPAQFPSKISPAHAGNNININGADLFPL